MINCKVVSKICSLNWLWFFNHLNTQRKNTIMKTSFQKAKSIAINQVTIIYIALNQDSFSEYRNYSLSFLLIRMRRSYSRHIVGLVSIHRIMFEVDFLNPNCEKEIYWFFYWIWTKSVPDLIFCMFWAKNEHVVCNCNINELIIILNLCWCYFVRLYYIKLKHYFWNKSKLRIRNYEK